MGSGKSKGFSASESDLNSGSIDGKKKVPVRRTVTALSQASDQLNIFDEAKKTVNSDCIGPTITEEEFEHGRLGLRPKEYYEEFIKSLAPGELFCDPDFPADASSLFYSDKPAQNIVWRRPKDLVEEWQYPNMILDGVTRDDIRQGSLGDCWFLSACAAISLQEKVMKNIIPKNQPLYGDNYKGIVQFRFWRFGDWVDVYIDDLLPTVKGKLIYARCTEPTEFWVALIEKAYAKLHGSYEAIEGGQTMNALIDMTGGVAERYDIAKTDAQLYRLMQRSIASDAFIACTRKGDWQKSFKADPNGLVSGHAYTVTDIRKVDFDRGDSGEEKLLRIRNPWGDGNEWKGSWSDNDCNWDYVSDKTKQEIALQQKDDGEFWMSYRDFRKQFQEVTICLTGPDLDGDGDADSCAMEVMKGEWVLGKSAGGSRNDLKEFSKNPQFVLTLHEPDTFNKDVDYAESEGVCSVVIALMQEHRRSKRNIPVKKLQIAFFLYKTNDPTKRLDEKHLRYHRDCGRSGVYINYREVSKRFELEPGHYVIIPSVFTTEEASFMLRVFAEKKFTLTGPYLQEEHYSNTQEESK